MSVLNENTLIGASAAGGGFEIDNSLRFNDDDSAYLSRTPSSAGNRKTWTWSGWVKRGNLGLQGIFAAKLTKDDTTSLIFESSGALLFTDRPSDVRNIDLRTTQLFRDVGAWYHLIVAVDTTQGTSTDRVKLYLNGSQITELTTTSYPSLNYDTAYWNNTQVHRIGASQETSTAYLDGYLSEVNFIDGQALTPDSFGETGDYGEWIPKAYAGARGTNGFYLDFKDSGSLGNDAAGSNNWTPTNLAATDQMLDTPTNNFCTLNTVDSGNASPDIIEGNLVLVAGGGWTLGFGTVLMTSGKWYFEGVAGTGNVQVGLSEQPNTNYTNYLGSVSTGYAYDADGSKYNNASGTAYGATYIAGDIIGIAFDADVGTLVFYKNNVSQGQAYSGLTASGGYVFAVARNFSVNFGQDSSFAGNKTAQGNSDANGIGDFYYAPPTGFLSLCTKNLPDATVVPNENFNTVLYTGTSADQAITGVGFQPDFSWIKRRDSAESHFIVDAVRGFVTAGQTPYVLASNETSADITSQTDSYESFDADGFSLGTDLGWRCNLSGATYASWNWKANGTGVSNTDGTITSTVSANVDAGFSIVTFSAAVGTVGHGLSSAPELMITKNRASNGDWHTYNVALGNTKKLKLNSTSGTANTGAWDDTTPTASLFSFGFSGGSDYLAYCFHSVEGYSKFGTYTGNGSTDGPFVYCGFKPAYFMIKRTDVANSWEIFDSKRTAGYNPAVGYVYAQSSNAEASNHGHDFLASGVKIRASNNGTNASGGSYIYLAFAETPFKHSTAR